MSTIKLGNLLWRPHTRPISPEDPVDVKDVNTADIKAKLEMVQSELALVKAELQEIKANQLSGDQKVQLEGSSLPPTLVFIDSDMVVPAGTSVSWGLSSSEEAEINKWPVFAIALSWKIGSTNLNYNVSCWQFLPNWESGSTPVPRSVQEIDTWSDNLSDRIFVARIRRFAMGLVVLRVDNSSQHDQILSNFSVQCMIEGV